MPVDEDRDMSGPPRPKKIVLLWALAAAAMVLGGWLALEVYLRGVFAD
jgi:hypothetical protein